MLDHLVPWEWHSALEVSVGQWGVRAPKVSVGPGKYWRDNDKCLLLVLVLVERLSQDLDDLLSLIEISAAEKIDHDAVSA